MKDLQDDIRRISRPKPIGAISTNKKTIQEILAEKAYKPTIDHHRLTRILQLNRIPSHASPRREGVFSQPISVEKFRRSRKITEKKFNIQNNTNILFRKESNMITYSPVEIRIDDSEEFLSRKDEPKPVDKKVKNIFSSLLQQSGSQGNQQQQPPVYQKKIDINLHIINKVISDLDLIEPAKMEIIEELGLKKYFNQGYGNNVININMNDKIEINPTNIFQAERSRKIQKLKRRMGQATGQPGFGLNKEKYKEDERRAPKVCSCNTKNMNEDQFLLSSAYDQKLTEVKFFWQGTNACLPFAFKKRIIDYYENTDDFDSYEILDFSRKTIQGDENPED